MKFEIPVRHQMPTLGKRQDTRDWNSEETSEPQEPVRGQVAWATWREEGKPNPNPWRPGISRFQAESAACGGTRLDLGFYLAVHLPSVLRRSSYGLTVSLKRLFQNAGEWRPRVCTEGSASTRTVPDVQRTPAWAWRRGGTGLRMATATSQLREECQPFKPQ